MPNPRFQPQVRVGVARGPEEFRKKAELAVAGGADELKIIASGAVLAFGGVPGEREMTPDEIKAVVDVAHAHGIKVAAHAHGAQSIKDAILAGADTIEHASLIDDAGIELAREHGVALSMDVYNGDYIDTVGRADKWPEEFLRKNVETTEAQRQAFTRAHRAGVDIVFGTDAAVYPHGLNARQFPIMVAARHDADGSDPVCHVAGREVHGLERSCRQRAAGPVRRSDRGARRSARGRQAVAGRRRS